jgi:two-component system response regulator YesN
VIKVAIVEDRVLTLMTLKSEIDWEKYGIEPLGFFENTEQALSAFEADQPDVLVTDIVMPGLSGLELCEKVSVLYPDTKLIIISAHSKYDYTRAAIQLKVFDFFEKPVDYDALVQCIIRAYEEKTKEDEIKRFIDMNTARYQEYCFIRLLLGNTSFNIGEEMLFLGPDLGQCQYVCVTFIIDYREQCDPDWKRIEMLYLLFYDKMKIRGNYDVWGPIRLKDNSLVAIIKESDAGAESLNDYLNDIIKDFTIKYLSDSRIYAGIGERVKNITDIAWSYDTALNAIKHRFLFDENRVFDAYDLKQSLVSNWIMLMRFEEEALKFLSVGDYNGLELAVKEMAGIISIGFISFEELEFCLNSILFKHDKQNIGADNKLKFSSTRERKNLSGLMDCFLQTCKQLCAQTIDRFQNHNIRVSLEIKAIIAQSYMQKDLNIKKISSIINLSPNYMISVFKKSTGSGINEYINKTRIESAKRLLAESDRKVYEISEDTGHSSQYYFSSNFKKNTGYSPLDYRKEFGRKV